MKKNHNVLSNNLKNVETNFHNWARIVLFVIEAQTKNNLKRLKQIFLYIIQICSRKKNDTENDLNLEDKENITDTSMDYDYFK